MFKDELRDTVWNEIRQHDLHSFEKQLTPQAFAEAARCAGVRIGCSALNLVNLVWLGIAAAKEVVPSQSKSSQQMIDSHINASPSLLRVRDAARLLQVSERMLWTLTDNGDIPCVRVGSVVRYEPAVIREWISRSQSSAQGK